MSDVHHLLSIHRDTFYAGGALRRHKHGGLGHKSGWKMSKQLAGPPLHPAIGRAAQFLGSLESGNVPTCLASR